MGNDDSEYIAIDDILVTDLSCVGKFLWKSGDGRKRERDRPTETGDRDKRTTDSKLTKTERHIKQTVKE